MRRTWICALFLLLTACGAEIAEHGEPALPQPEAAREAPAAEEAALEVDGHAFTIRLTGDRDRILTLVEVLENGEVVQSFPVEADTAIGHGVIEEDMNFDGWTDFAAMQYIGANNWGLHCWLWDPAAEQFAYSEELSELPSPEFTQNGIISGVYWSADLCSVSLLQWEDGTLAEIRKMAPFQEGNAPVYVYSERLNGELTAMRRWEDGGKEREEIKNYFQKLFHPAENEAVSTGGDRAFLAVAESVPGAEEGTWELTVTLYDTADLTVPVQTLGETAAWDTCSIRWMDANFDGYPDICYTTHTSARNDYTAWWLWDAETGRFERSETLSGLALLPDAETGRMTQWEEWTTQTYAYRIYEWQGKQLVCLRETKKNWAENGDMTLVYTVTDDPMGAARLVWQSRCMAGTEEEEELDAKLERYMDYDYKG